MREDLKQYVRPVLTAGRFVCYSVATYAFITLYLAGMAARDWYLSQWCPGIKSGEFCGFFVGNPIDYALVTRNSLEYEYGFSLFHWLIFASAFLLLILHQVEIKWLREQERNK